MMLVLDDQHLMADRRRSPRVRISRPCKVHDPRSGKYLSGSTRDLSSGGVLLEIDRPLDIAPGQTLHVGIAQKRREVLIREADMVELQVVRALGTPDGRTVVAGRWMKDAAAEVPLRMAA